jgi:positive regulator of sigma E activity
MTCGGLIFLAGMFIAAAWLSDVVGSVWPLGVAGVLLLLSIAWRFFEYYARRDEIKRLDAIYEEEMRRNRDQD